MANEVFYFPQEIIEHIQSFLNARDQAQSSILSKSWYISCPTRPVLDFDEKKFTRKCKVFSYEFSKFCTETLNRYNTRNFKLDKFTLLMNIGKEDSSRFWGKPAYDFPFSLRNKLAGKLITSALELGVSEIELKLNYHANFNSRYDLPAQIFASTSLIRLSVDRYIIDGVIGDRVLCSHLKSLVLDKVKTTGDILCDIFARCPLIENLDLDLCECVGMGKLNVSKLINLVEFRVLKCIRLKVEFMDFDGMNVTEFRCLRRLHLEKVTIGAEFFTRFGSMFPCIEDLTLGYCGDYDEINISSHSIRHLSLYQGERFKKVQLNIPNISKFAFEAGGDDIHMNINHFKPLPSLSFDNVSKDWESDVRLMWRCDVIQACWFKNLRKFLNQLTLSRISLQVSFVGQSVIPGEEIPCLPPVVENLKVCSRCARATLDSLLLGLATSCQSNSITECTVWRRMGGQYCILHYKTLATS